MTNDCWMLKLIALLHDPPDKTLALRDHQRRAFQRMEELLGNSTFQSLFGVAGTQLTRAQFEATSEGQAVKKADKVASAMDRTAFPQDIILGTLNFLNNPRVSHSLAGRQQLLNELQHADLSTVAPALDKVVDDAITATTTPQQRYLWIWRKFSDELTKPDAAGSLAKDWHLVPADTRIVDHTLWDHLSMTAALVTALPHVALLVCSVGPVQDFIRTARRTQDLWMGSYILSYLAWKGIEIIADQFGPDTVLYPSLRGQPLVDNWLSKIPGLKDVRPSPDNLTRATLPNKFVALLPAGEARSVAGLIENRIRTAWVELADEVAKWLGGEVKVSIDPKWQEIFDDHKQQMPEVYWSIHRWPDVSMFSQPKEEADAALDGIRRLLNPSPDWEFRCIYDIYCATAPRMVNVGTVYSRLHDLAQRGFESRKTLRDFAPIEECGEKCTLCGVRVALHTDGPAAKKHWEDIAAKVRQNVKGEHVTIKPGGRERLCGVCTVKRFVRRSFFGQKDQLGLRGGFPSTSSVAAASFKAKVIQKLINEQLQKVLQEHVDALRQLDFCPFSKDTGKRILPRLTKLCSKLPEDLQKLATDLLCYDGAAFYEETFTVERLKDDYNMTIVTQPQVDAVQHTLHSLLMVCRDLDIDPPAKYFAVLMLDGDEMGKWLSGEKAPLFSQVLHPEVVNDLRNKYPAWNTVLDSKRVLSPALHTAISSALANFALHLVPLVVEQHYCGRLVYAGGDDVLALLPVDQVLPASRELRALFSGEAEIDVSHDVNVQVYLRDPKISGFMKFNDAPLMTMGPAATASVGIAIAHHLSPLDATLAAARRAEESAKRHYERNALCIHFLKRSGEKLRMGAQWFYRDTPLNAQDTVGLFTKIQQRFTDKKISMKFAHTVFDEARTLAAVPDALEAELHRLLKRHHGADLNSQQSQQQANDLAPELAQLARSLDVHCPNTDPLPDEPQPGAVELAKWLLLLRFLAQGGGE